MTNAWTKGPWDYDGKFTVCIPHAKGLTCFRTNPEDARLIAAAPDMAEALEGLLLIQSVHNSPAVRLAKAALAKARGEAP